MLKGACTCTCSLAADHLTSRACIIVINNVIIIMQAHARTSLPYLEKMTTHCRGTFVYRAAIARDFVLRMV